MFRENSKTLAMLTYLNCRNGLSTNVSLEWMFLRVPWSITEEMDTMKKETAKKHKQALLVFIFSLFIRVPAQRSVWETVFLANKNMKVNFF